MLEDTQYKQEHKVDKYLPQSIAQLEKCKEACV